MSGFLNLNRIDDTIYVQGQFGPTRTSYVAPAAPTIYSVLVTGFKTASSNLNSVGVIFPRAFNNVGVNGNMTLYRYA